MTKAKLEFYMKCGEVYMKELLPRSHNSCGIPQTYKKVNSLSYLENGSPESALSSDTFSSPRPL